MSIINTCIRAARSVFNTNMGVEDREEIILEFLHETGLSLPAYAIHYNIMQQYRGAAWGPQTTNRRLAEMESNGYVSKIQEGRGLYQITEEGRDRLQELKDR